MQVVLTVKPVLGELEMRKVFKISTDDDESNNFVLFADIPGDRGWKIINEQVNLVDQNKGKRSIDGGSTAIVGINE